MKRSQGKIAALFLLPYLLVFFIFRVIPSVGGLAMSFFKWNIVGNAKFAGINNFVRLTKDPYFAISLKNTFLFFFMTLPPLIIVSLLLAVLMNQKVRLTHAVRTISIMPYVLIPAVVGIIWNWLYDNNFGILNYYLKGVGLRPIQWLTNDKWALFSVAIVTVWSYLGYNMILFLAGLQDISVELYEASRIDGATGYQTFMKITLPLLKPITSMIITLTLINVIQIFDQIFVMTNGGPGTATLTIVQYLYGSAFQNYDIGYGSTLGVAVLVILIVLIQIKSRLIKDND
ncbi:MAG TPA: sugar ABC transporter permease [Ruminiclostridium sp.]